MTIQMTRTDTIADNLANVDTTAFKKELSVFQSTKPTNIYRVEDQSMPPLPAAVQSANYIGDMVNGAQFVRNYTDYSQGSLRVTGNPLDVAIEGPDYFSVRTPAGIRYTRDGSFQENANGTLVTNQGYQVLDTQNRPIILPTNTAATPTIAPDGTIAVNNQPVAQLDRVTLPRTLAIQKQGDNLYQYAGPVGAPQGTVRQGMLEASNSNAIKEMVNLIEAQRAYEASSKALAEEDSALQQAVTTVGESKP